MKPLIHHLLGETRTAVLAAVLLRPEQALHLRELERLSGMSAGALHRELTALTALGVLRRETIGRQVMYQADPRCPVLEELTGLLRKTAGVVDVLRGALASAVDGIDVAFVYGSMAAGTAGAGSDIDVMIVGDIGFADAVRLLADTGVATGRDVNPTVMGMTDFRQRLAMGDHFVTTIWNGPRLWVMGSMDELGQSGSDRQS